MTPDTRAVRMGIALLEQQPAWRTTDVYWLMHRLDEACDEIDRLRALLPAVDPREPWRYPEAAR